MGNRKKNGKKEDADNIVFPEIIVSCPDCLNNFKVTLDPTTDVIVYLNGFFQTTCPDCLVIVIIPACDLPLYFRDELKIQQIVVSS